MHFMLDIETLGIKTGSAIISIGAVAFDIRGIHARFYEVTIPPPWMTIEYETVCWWMGKDTRARMIFSDSVTAIPLNQALLQLSFFINNPTLDGVATTSVIDGVWGHGSVFDIPRLEFAYERLGSKAPWSYKQVRDTRTLYAFFDKRLAENTHNALEDAEAQAKLVIQIMMEQKVRDVPDAPDHG